MEDFYLLTNDKFVTFGKCSEHQYAKQGDYIAWDGYLKEGLISAVQIRILTKWKTNVCLQSFEDSGWMVYLLNFH